MALFNRYETSLDFVQSALNEYDDKHCNPEDYFVTEDECRKYIEELKRGQRLNREWNHRRRTFWEWFVAGCGYLLTIFVPCFLWYWFDLENYLWGWPLSFIVTGIVGGTSIFVFNRVAEYMHSSTLYKSEYFPPINDNIERLFDDYLWKWKVEKNIDNKNIK